MALRNIQDIVDFERFVIRKERGIFISIEEATASLDTAQMDLMELFFADFAKTERIHDALRPFMVYQDFTSDATGKITFPADYMHFLGNAVVIVGSTIYKIIILNNNEWADAIRSQLRPATVTSPIAKDISGGFQLYPFQTHYGQYDYLRRPATPVYAYTQSGRTITYNFAGSTQLEWADNYINPIMFRSLSFYGIDMDDDKVIQYSEMQKQEEQ